MVANGRPTIINNSKNYCYSMVMADGNKSNALVFPSAAN